VTAWGARHRHDLLDASAGGSRSSQLLLTRRMHVSQLHQWMRLAPLVEELPGCPRRALRGTVGGISAWPGGWPGVAGGVAGGGRTGARAAAPLGLVRPHHHRHLPAALRVSTR
jgi:hypothetical protein